MDLSDMDYRGVKIEHLPENVQQAVKLWQGNVLTSTGKQGLWVFGKRDTGTTYAAMVATGRLAFDEDGFFDTDHIEAVDLIELVRASWQAAASIRQYGEDFAVFTEAQKIQDRLFHLFYDCKLLWVDDLHHDTIDWNIYRKNIQPYVERRVKHGMPTVVSTTLPPVHDYLPGKVIENHFVLAYCGDGAR